MMRNALRLARRMRPALLCASLLLSTGWGWAHAQEASTAAEEALPALPAPLQPDAPALPFLESATQRFAIIDASVTLHPRSDPNSPDTLSYVLHTLSQSGARSASFEEMRCDTGARRLLALARADGRWVRTRQAPWTDTSSREAQQQHMSLYREYFCEGGRIAGRTAAILLQRLRAHAPIKPY